MFSGQKLRYHSSPSLPHKPRLSLIACMERGLTLLLIPDKNLPEALTRQWSSLTLRVSVTRPSFRQGEVAHAGDRRRSAQPNRKAAPHDAGRVVGRALALVSAGAARGRRPFAVL